MSLHTSPLTQWRVGRIVSLPIVLQVKWKAEALTAAKQLAIGNAEWSMSLHTSAANTMAGRSDYVFYPLSCRLSGKLKRSPLQNNWRLEMRNGQ